MLSIALKLRKEADEVFLELANSNDNAIIWGVLRVALDRKLPIPREKLAEWSQRVELGIRTRARKLNSLLGYPELPVFDPAEKLNDPELTKLLARLTPMWVRLPPPGAPLVVLRETSIRQKSSPDRSTDRVGWKVATNNADNSVVIMLPAGGNETHKLGEFRYRRVEILSDVRPALEAIGKHRSEETEDRRMPTNYALRNLVPPRLFRPDSRFGDSIWLDELLVGLWLHSQGRLAEAGTILLPALGAVDIEEDIVSNVHRVAGNDIGHAMLDAFAYRQYEHALDIAKRIDREFKGSPFHQVALRLISELPRRQEDFRTLKLPTAEEWQELKSTLSRVEQIKYLCKRLRLVRGGDTGWTYLRPDTDPSGKKVINLKVELAGLKLIVADIQHLAPFLRVDWLSMRMGAWRS
jgi:hypothetical protein